MNPYSKDEFKAAWEQIDNPREMERRLADDQSALEERQVYRSPEGLYFEVSRKLPCGTVITDTGIWLTPDYFSQCERFL